MEASTEAWRLTLPTLKFIAKEKFKLAKPQPKPKKPQPEQPDTKPEFKVPEEKKEQPECNQDTPCCTTCRYVKSKTCGSDKTGLRCKKAAPVVIPSVASISKSVNANCRHCCCTFCEFLKEAYKTTQGDPKTRVSDVLSEISDIILAIANDCVLFVRRIGATTASAVANQSHKYVSMARNSFTMAKDKVKNLGRTQTPTSNVPDEKTKVKGVLKTENAKSIEKLKGYYHPDQSSRRRQNETTN